MNIRYLKSSLVLRLTIWYSIISFLFAVLAATTMYWLLANHLENDADQYLRARLNEISTIIGENRSTADSLLAELQREASNSPSSQVKITRKNGESLIESPELHRSIFSQYSMNAEETTKDKSSPWQSPDGARYRIMWREVTGQEPLVVQIALDRTSEEKLLADYREALVIIISLLFLAAATGGIFIAKRELRPLSKLGSLVSTINAEGLHQRLGEYPWPVEIQPLTASFDQVLSHLEDAFARVSQFSADIAHELRTPLHVLRGEAEIALTRKASIDDYRACLESAAEEYSRLSLLVDGLLFLAKSSQGETPLKLIKVSCSEEVSAVCDFYQAMADEENIQLRVDVAGSLWVDVGLFRRALGNLIANAIRYTPAGGSIAITSHIANDNGFDLSVSDTGMGIDTDALSKVFDRFYRSDQARSRTSEGSGLGLPIVKSIMQLHRGSVVIESSSGRGTQVTLHFPPYSGD